MATLRGDDRRTLEEAAAWFTRLKQGSVSEHDIEAFFEWRRDEANSSAYAEVEGRLKQIDRLENDPELVRLTEAALRRPSRQERRRRGVRRWAWPAGLLAVVSVLAVVLVAPRLGPPTYATDVGAQQIVRLEDGSVMRLNTDSRARVIYREDERRIELVRGEAYFEVAKDPQRPFIVSAGETRVRALGTKFDVRRGADATQVTLVEGSVQVRRAAAPEAWTLRPNEQILVNGRTPRPSAADAEEVISWTTGRLRFRRTALEDAIAEVNRYSRTKIVLESGAAADVPLSGDFDAGDTPGFASAVAEIFSLKVTRTAGEIRLEPIAPTPEG